MKWLGPMLHLMFPPRHDAHLAALAQMLTEQRDAVAQISATRERLEQRAAREPIDDLADGL